MLAQTGRETDTSVPINNNEQGHICYYTPDNTAMMVWTILESQLYITKIGCGGAAPYPSAIYQSISGKVKYACFGANIDNNPDVYYQFLVDL